MSENIFKMQSYSLIQNQFISVVIKYHVRLGNLHLQNYNVNEFQMIYEPKLKTCFATKYLDQVVTIVILSN